MDFMIQNELVELSSISVFFQPHPTPHSVAEGAQQSTNFE